MYMIKSLVVQNGKLVVPGAHHVSDQGNGFFIAYGPMDKKTRRPSFHAVVYCDESGNFLVQADQDVLDMMPGGETLQSLASRDPSSWYTWKCDIVDKTGEVKEKNKVIKIDKIKLDVTKDKPIALDSETDIVGAIPTVPGSIANFVVEEIEKECNWIGDKAEKVEIIDELRLQD